jgi:hypothetical protein
MTFPFDQNLWLVFICLGFLLCLVYLLCNHASGILDALARYRQTRHPEPVVPTVPEASPLLVAPSPEPPLAFPTFRLTISAAGEWVLEGAGTLLADARSVTPETPPTVSSGSTASLSGEADASQQTTETRPAEIHQGSDSSTDNDEMPPVAVEAAQVSEAMPAVIAPSPPLPSGKAAELPAPASPTHPAATPPSVSQSLSRSQEEALEAILRQLVPQILRQMQIVAKPEADTK